MKKQYQIIVYALLLLLGSTSFAQEGEKPAEGTSTGNTETPDTGDKDKPGTETESEKAEREKKEKAEKEKKQKESESQQPEVHDVITHKDENTTVFDRYVDGKKTTTHEIEIHTGGSITIREVGGRDGGYGGDSETGGQISSPVAKETEVQINSDGNVKLNSHEVDSQEKSNAGSNGYTGINSGNSPSRDPGFMRMNDRFNETITNRNSHEYSGDRAGARKLTQSETKGIVERSSISTYEQLVAQGREAKRAIDSKYQAVIHARNVENQKVQDKVAELSRAKRETENIQVDLQNETERKNSFEVHMETLINQPSGELGRIYQERGKIFTPTELAKLETAIHDLNKYSQRTFSFIPATTVTQWQEADYSRRKYENAVRVINHYFPGTSPGAQSYVDEARILKMKEDLALLQKGMDNVAFNDVLSELDQVINELKTIRFTGSGTILTPIVDHLEGYVQHRISQHLVGAVSSHVSVWAFDNQRPISTDLRPYYQANVNEMMMAIRKGDYLKAGAIMADLNETILGQYGPQAQAVEAIKLEEYVIPAMKAYKNVKLGTKVAGAVYKYGFKNAMKRLSRDPKFVAELAKKAKSKLKKEALTKLESEMEARKQMLAILEDLEQMENGQTRVYSSETESGPLSAIVTADFSGGKNLFGAQQTIPVSDYFYRETYTVEKTANLVTLYGYYDDQTKSYSPFWSLEENGAIADPNNPNLRTVGVIVPAGEVMYRGYLSPTKMMDHRNKSKEQFLFVFNSPEEEHRTIMKRWGLFLKK